MFSSTDYTSYFHEMLSLCTFNLIRVLWNWILELVGLTIWSLNQAWKCCSGPLCNLTLKLLRRPIQQVLLASLECQFLQNLLPVVIKHPWFDVRVASLALRKWYKKCSYSPTDWTCADAVHRGCPKRSWNIFSAIKMQIISQKFR